MGASTFAEVSRGADARAAFASAVDDARHEHGRGGYSGSIAEKRDFVMIRQEPMTLKDARRLGDTLIEQRDSRVDDKWGPAGCIPLTDGRFYFFGWASS